MKRPCCDGHITGLDETVAKEYLEDVRDEIKKLREDEFLDDPTVWLEKHCSPENLFGPKVPKDENYASDGWLPKKGEWKHTCCSSSQEVLNKLDEGILYVLLVSGVMKETKKYEEEDQERRNDRRMNSYVNVNSTKDDNRNSPQRCHPIWIAAALVTENHLERVEDPIKIAFKLRAAIREHCKSSEFMYKNIYEDHLRRLPREFAEALLNECLSPEETECLMDIKDRNVLFDLQTGKFREITQRPTYKKLYREEIIWVAPVYESFIWYGLSGFRRCLWLIFWNIVYPFNEAYKILSGGEKCLHELCPISHRQLFSPISCYIADIVNYFIMIALIAAVMLQFRPNQESTKELVTQYLQGNVSLDHPRLKAGSTEGIILVELDRYPISLTGWTLFLCFLSRILIELYQLSCKQIWSAVPERLCFMHTWKKTWKKMKRYLNCGMNKVDLFLLGFLFTALGIDFHYSYSSHFIYGRICVKEGGCGEGIDYTLEARRVIYMTNFYSIALLLSLVRLFYCVFLFVPIIGPILRSIQSMIKDIFKVVVILIFFSIGFFIPLFAIIQCYTSVFTSSKEIAQASKLPEKGPSKDDEVFAVMKSPTTGFVTMILSIMEGKLTYSDDLYESKDTSTNIFFFFIMFFYFLIFGLLCFNLLIALISKRYDTMMDNKNRDWQFAQFDLLMDYLCIESNVDNKNDTHCDRVCNDGMPFFFPFCLLYVPCRLISSRIKKHLMPKRRKQEKNKSIELEEGKEKSGGSEAIDKLVRPVATDEPETSIYNKQDRKKVIERVLKRRRNRINRANKDYVEKEQARRGQGDNDTETQRHRDTETQRHRDTIFQ